MGQMVLPPLVNTLVNTTESNKQALLVSGANSTMRMYALPPLEMIIDDNNDAIINKDGVNCLQQGLPTNPKTPNTAQKHNSLVLW